MLEHLRQTFPALSEGMLPWFVGGILAGVLIVTLLLRLATRLVTGFYPPWMQALSALICAQVASLMVSHLYAWALGGISDNSGNVEGSIGAYSAGVLSQIVTYSLVLREEVRNSITMIQATALCAPQIFLLACFVSESVGATPHLAGVPEIQESAEDAKKLLPSASLAPAALSNFTLMGAQREALRRHPDLGVAGSRMNVVFLERYHRYQKERPEYFHDATWPVRLADETASDIQPR